MLCYCDRNLRYVKCIAWVNDNVVVVCGPHANDPNYYYGWSESNSNNSQVFVIFRKKIMCVYVVEKYHNNNRKTSHTNTKCM